MRGAPQVGFSVAILRMSAMTSGSRGGRPCFFVQDFHFQMASKPWRCQRATVSGFTRIRLNSHLSQYRFNRIQKSRSRRRSFGRLTLRRRTASCWRSVRFSSSRLERSLQRARMTVSNMWAIAIGKLRGRDQKRATWCWGVSRVPGELCKVGRMGGRAA